MITTDEFMSLGKYDTATVVVKYGMICECGQADRFIDQEAAVVIAEDHAIAEDHDPTVYAEFVVVFDDPVELGMFHAESLRRRLESDHDE